MGRNVITLWMSLITLQMIAHMILLKTLISEELLIYLRNLLDIMRLKFTRDTSDIQVPNILF